MKSITTKKKLSPLEEELKAIDYSFNVARSKYSFSYGYKVLGPIATLFGVKIHDAFLYKKSIVFKDIELFRDQIKQLTKEKYATRKYIQENCSFVQAKQEVEVKIQGNGIQTLQSSDESESKEEHDSIFNPKFTEQTVGLLLQKDGCNQVKAARELFDNLHYKELRAQLLQAQTGAGKTYILASVVKNFIANDGITKAKCISPWPIVYITKSSIVEQTKNVFANEFGIDVVNTVHILNIEFLRTEFGSLFVAEKPVIINGVPTMIYEWKKNTMPCLFIWDECQILARDISIQAQIAQDVGRCEERWPTKRIFQIFASATPFSRVCEARCFCVGTGVKFRLGVGDIKLTDAVWPQFAKLIAAPADPTEYVEAAVKRLVDKMEPYIVRVKNVRPRHRAKNSVTKIHFRNIDEQLEYDGILARYQEEKAKIENDPTIKNKSIATLAVFTILRKGVERIRAPILAEWMNEQWLAGYAPVLACCFKGTITRTYRILVEQYGWTRDYVSIIWGGSTETLSKKKKLALRIKHSDAFQELLKKEGIDLEELNIDIENLEEKTEEQLAFEKIHGLTSQKPEERDRERLRFQHQKSRGCIFTFKSGGVGLSTHHQYEYARPRKCRLTPVYSEKELIQGLGRCPRITSLSDTEQDMCYYVGTIEDHVAMRVKQKLKCMRTVIRSDEDWSSIVTGKIVEQSKEFEEVDKAMDEVETNQLMEYVEKD